MRIVKLVSNFLMVVFIFTACSKMNAGIDKFTETMLPSDGKGYSEILGRPTNSTVTMSILFDQPSEV